MKPIISSILLLAAVLGMSACGPKDITWTDPKPSETTPPAKTTGMALGADVSWLTEMEAKGYKFYTPGTDRREMECMKLLRDCCKVNSIRLRVWVNPEQGWNGLQDVLVKARRAESLGLRTMIDFHFSDSWADPGKQVPPKAWQDMNLDRLCQAAGAHVTTTLTALKQAGVTPEWVQIGNETTPGMLLPLGSMEHPDQLARLFNAGYDAAKAVFADIKVIIHLDSGHKQSLYDYYFDTLKPHGVKYDIIGMSVYPYWAEQQGLKGGWRQVATDCIANIEHLRGKYGKPVMVCEVGMPYDQATNCRDLIASLLSAKVEGVFYWEPQASPGYNGGYTLGCFNNNSPTVALDAFRNYKP